MRNTLFILGLLFLLGACNQKPQKADLKIMSFNVRYDTPRDSMNNWQYRKEEAGKMLNYYAPDIVGMQEVLHNQLEDIKSYLPQYTALGVGREDGREKGEFNPLFFKTDRFELVKSGNFSLSETPEVIGVRGWDAVCKRIATWAVLKDKASGIEFMALNTHLDHKGETARKESARLLVNQLVTLAETRPFVMTGDFNTTPDSAIIGLLTEEGKVKNAKSEAALVYGPEWTFHDFGRLSLPERMWIDYIFISPGIQVKTFRNITDVPDTVFLSDHNPVLSEITVLR